MTPLLLQTYDRGFYIFVYLRNSIIALCAKCYTPIDWQTCSNSFKRSNSSNVRFDSSHSNLFKLAQTFKLAQSEVCINSIKFVQNRSG